MSFKMPSLSDITGEVVESYLLSGSEDSGDWNDHCGMWVSSLGSWWASWVIAWVYVKLVTVDLEGHQTS